MLPGTPPELSVEAERLAEKVTSSFPSAGGTKDGLLENCPACGVEIPLADTASAVCSNGHRWREAFITFDVCPLRLMHPSATPARCSITSFILAETMVRTCLGCARKAFLPAARSLYRPEGERDVTTDVRASTRGTAENPVLAEDLGAEHRPGWLAQELLKAVRRCLFCGNNFATLI
jgi:general transcription factor 3C protein 4